MTVVLDTTALLAWHLDHPDRAIVVSAVSLDPDWCASEIALTEALAICERITDEHADALRQAVVRTWDFVNVVPVDADCLARAGELARDNPLRLTDAIHLAAAQRLPQPIRYVTFDANQMPVAELLGFELISR
jgi:uncharacterized protein